MASRAHLLTATRSNSTRRFILIPIQSSLSVTIQQLATFATKFANLFQAWFVKPTKVLLPRMEQVHAFKREQFRFILTMMMDKNTSLSSTTAYITLIHWWIYSPHDDWQRSLSILMATPMSKLELNRDIPLMSWHGLLAIIKRLFRRHYRVFRNYYLTRVIKHSSPSAWKFLHIPLWH